MSLTITVTKDDTLQTLFDKYRAEERAFRDQHYRETGIVWPGSVGICFNLPANLRYKLAQMLHEAGIPSHVCMDMPGTLFGFPVFTVAATKEKT